MRFFLFFLALISMHIPDAHAKIDKRTEYSLRSLDPQTRLEQVCDIEAMDRIGKDKSNNHEPDRAIGDATQAPVLKGTTLIVNGGALRSHGHWYHLAYTCTGSENFLSVEKFTYTLGERIPQSEWDKDNLWK